MFCGPDKNAEHLAIPAAQPASPTSEPMNYPRRALSGCHWLALVLGTALVGQGCGALEPEVAEGTGESAVPVLSLNVFNRDSAGQISLAAIAGQFPYLEELWVGGEPLPLGELNELSGMKNLRSLRLGLDQGTAGNESDELRLPPCLETLFLQAFPLDWLPGLVEALHRTPSATQLGLHAVGLDPSHGEVLSQLRWIEELGLENNLSLTGEIIGSLAEIESLRGLGLNGTSIHTPWQEIFQEIPQLQSLYAWGAPRYRRNLEAEVE